MEALIDFALSKDCTDIFVDEGSRGFLKAKKTTYTDVKRTPITRENILDFFKIYDKRIHDDILKMLSGYEITSIDAAINYKGRRFRANICKIHVDGMDRAGLSVTLRILNAEVPDIDRLNLPEAIKNIEKFPNGLVLVIGETGSGKTMTLAGCLQEINKTQRKNIITIEDPIEYVYKHEKCRIIQREVGQDVATFADGVRDAMRQAPDIILVGEMRDLETIKAAIELAETGHLVFGTLHAKSCTDTADRLVDVFPPGQQQQIRVELASVLRTVVHQRLVKNFQNKIVPLVEIMVVNSVISAGIKDPAKARSSEIRDQMRANAHLGNVHVVDNAIWHFQNGRLNEEDIDKFLTEADALLAKDVLRRGL